MIGAPEILVLLFFGLVVVLPIYVTHQVLDARGRSETWKLILVFFTGWLGALAFIVFDR